MADWMTLAIVHLMVGFEADVVGMISYGGSGTDTQALLIIAFLVYIVVAALVAMTKLADLEHNLIINIVILVGVGIIALFLIIGVGLDGGSNGNIDPYGATLEISAALLALLGGTFLLLNMFCGDRKTDPS